MRQWRASVEAEEALALSAEAAALCERRPDLSLTAIRHCLEHQRGLKRDGLLDRSDHLLAAVLAVPAVSLTPPSRAASKAARKARGNSERLLGLGSVWPHASTGHGLGPGGVYHARSSQASRDPQALLPVGPAA